MLFIRSLLTNIFFFGTLGIGCIIQLPLALLPQKATIFYWDRIIMPIALFWVRFLGGIKLELRGAENIRNHNVLYACKHESALETYSFTQFSPTTTYILKRELIFLPFFGWRQRRRRHPGSGGLRPADLVQRHRLHPKECIRWQRLRGRGLCGRYHRLHAVSEPVQ